MQKKEKKQVRGPLVHVVVRAAFLPLYMVENKNPL